MDCPSSCGMFSLPHVSSNESSTSSALTSLESVSIVSATAFSASTFSATAFSALAASLLSRLHCCEGPFLAFFLSGRFEGGG